MNHSRLESVYGQRCTPGLMQTPLRYTGDSSQGCGLADIVSSSSEEGALTPSRSRVEHSAHESLRRSLRQVQARCLDSEQRLDALIVDCQAHQDSVARVFDELACFVQSDSNYASSLGKRLRSVLRTTSHSPSPARPPQTPTPTQSQKPRTTEAAVGNGKGRNVDDKKKMDRANEEDEEEGAEDEMQEVERQKMMKKKVDGPGTIDRVTLNALIDDRVREHVSALRLQQQSEIVLRDQRVHALERELFDVKSLVFQQQQQQQQLQQKQQEETVRHNSGSNVATQTVPTGERPGNESPVTEKNFLRALEQIRELTERVHAMELMRDDDNDDDDDHASSGTVPPNGAEGAVSPIRKTRDVGGNDGGSEALLNEISQLEEYGNELSEIHELYTTLQSQLREMPNAVSPPPSPAPALNEVEMTERITEKLRQEFNVSSLLRRFENQEASVAELQASVAEQLAAFEKRQREYTASLVSSAQARCEAAASADTSSAFEKAMMVVEENRAGMRRTVAEVEAALVERIHTQSAVSLNEARQAMAATLDEVRGAVYQDFQQQATALRSQFERSLETTTNELESMWDERFQEVAGHVAVASKDDSSTKLWKKDVDRAQTEVQEAMAVKLEEADHQIRLLLAGEMSRLKQTMEAMNDNTEKRLSALVDGKMDEVTSRLLRETTPPRSPPPTPPVIPRPPSLTEAETEALIQRQLALCSREQQAHRETLRAELQQLLHDNYSDVCNRVKELSLQARRDAEAAVRERADMSERENREHLEKVDKTLREFVNSRFAELLRQLNELPQPLSQLEVESLIQKYLNPLVARQRALREALDTELRSAVQAGIDQSAARTSESLRNLQGEQSKALKAVYTAIRESQLDEEVLFQRSKDYTDSVLAKHQAASEKGMVLLRATLETLVREEAAGCRTEMVRRESEHERRVQQISNAVGNLVEEKPSHASKEDLAALAEELKSKAAKEADDACRRLRDDQAKALENAEKELARKVDAALEDLSANVAKIAEKMDSGNSDIEKKLDELEKGKDELEDELAKACSHEAMEKVFGEVKDWLLDLETRSVSKGVLTQALSAIDVKLSDLRTEFYLPKSEEKDTSE